MAAYAIPLPRLANHHHPNPIRIGHCHSGALQIRMTPAMTKAGSITSEQPSLRTSSPAVPSGRKRGGRGTDRRYRHRLPAAGAFHQRCLAYRTSAAPSGSCEPPRSDWTRCVRLSPLGRNVSEMKQRPERSPEEIQGSIRHVGYELTTMVRQFTMMERARDRGSSDAEPIVQVCFEAALLHARNLIEFLTYNATGDSTMHPSDFGSAWVGRLADPTINKIVNRHLTHLRWERVTDPLPTWFDMRPLVDDLLGLFREFVKSTPQGDLFRPLLAQAIEDFSSLMRGRSRLASVDTSSTVITTTSVQIPPRGTYT